MSKSLIIAIILAIITLSLTMCVSEVLPQSNMDEKLLQDAADYLKASGQPPVEYVLSKFKDHDIVILGENHRARQDPLLIQSLIPRLPEVGVYTLCTEFARRIDQPLIDSLLAGKEYDERLAELITFQQFVHWGYVEYVDIFKAAWQYNHDRPAGTRAFRILGVNNAPEWWHIETQAERDDPKYRRQVWHGETEKDWADVVIREVVDKSEKALGYCGMHHAFTEYRQPVSDNGKFVRYVDDRFGRYLYNAIGKRVITIYLHNCWANVEGWDKPFVHPADGYVDALMEKLGPGAYPVGFDTRGTPPGKFPGKTSIYSFGYDDFTLGDYCDGYIFQMPFPEFEPVTCIDGFYTGDNIDYARRNAVNPWFRDKSIADFEEACQEERREVVERWSNLE